MAQGLKLRGSFELALLTGDGVSCQGSLRFIVSNMLFAVPAGRNNRGCGRLIVVAWYGSPAEFSDALSVTCAGGIPESSVSWVLASGSS